MIVAISGPDEMGGLTGPQRRFPRIKANPAIIKWMLGFNIVALLVLLLMVNC